MLKYTWLAVIISICAAILVTTCVESEKRTAKKVDVSGAQIYQTDTTKTRIRIAINTPPELKESVGERLYMEIDDGAMRYAFTSGVLVADSADTSGVMYSPWVNTPDSGEIAFKFHLRDDAGSNLVSDVITMDLGPDFYWQVEIGVYDSSPCAVSTEIALCRDYTLPRAVQSTEADRLYVIWYRMALFIPEADTSDSQL